MTYPNAKNLQDVLNQYKEKIQANEWFTHFLGNNKRDCFIIWVTDNDISKLEMTELQVQVAKTADQYGLENVAIWGWYSDERKTYFLDVSYAMDIGESYNTTRQSAIDLWIATGQECIVELMNWEVNDFIDCE